VRLAGYLEGNQTHLEGNQTPYLTRPSGAAFWTKCACVRACARARVCVCKRTQGYNKIFPLQKSFVTHRRENNKGSLSWRRRE